MIHYQQVFFRWFRHEQDERDVVKALIEVVFNYFDFDNFIVLSAEFKLHSSDKLIGEYGFHFGFHDIPFIGVLTIGRVKLAKK